MTEMQELQQLYERVYEDGFFIKEYLGLAGVGDVRDLEWLAQQEQASLEEILDQVGMGAIVDLTTPGTGKTRVERVYSAWQEAKHLRDTFYFPRLTAVRTRLGLSVQDSKPLGTF